MNDAEPKNLESYWHDKAVRQGLTLATLCDMVLGEDPQRDDETLIRSVRVLLSRAEKQTPNSTCTCDTRTGWTTVKCCNDCGAPIPVETWHIQALEHARELLRDICLQQVNEVDEAEKWLRAYGWPFRDDHKIKQMTEPKA